MLSGFFALCVPVSVRRILVCYSYADFRAVCCVFALLQETSVRALCSRDEAELGAGVRLRLRVHQCQQRAARRWASFVGR